MHGALLSCLSITVFTSLLALANVVSIYFLFYLSYQKQWGEGKFGRLGHGTERNCHSPRLVESLLGKRPVQVACGGFHTAAITEDGKMWTFGGGEHGQLGHGDKVNKVKPTVVQALEGIFVSQITCGWSHSVALTSKGRVYVSRTRFSSVGGAFPLFPFLLLMLTFFLYTLVGPIFCSRLILFIDLG